MWRYGDPSLMRSDKRGLRNCDYGDYKRGKFGSKGSSHQNERIYRKQLSKDSTSSRSSFKSSFKRSYSVRVTPPPDAIEDEPDPGPPSLTGIEPIKGYENITFTPVNVPPPCIPSQVASVFGPLRSSLPNPSEIDEREARKALSDYVSNRYCYGKGVAKNMLITKMDHSSAYHYSLETYTESRQVCWTYEAYLGGHLNSPVSGKPPHPWEVHVESPASFECHTTSLPIPHTDCLRTCHSCGGVGRKRCYTCIGTGWETCYSCSGDGYKPHPFIQGDNERCFHCHGNGKRKCWRCNGDGMSSCKTCSGTGQIKCYIKLTVNWTNHVDDFIIDQEDIPKERLKLVSGHIVFDETSTKVWPINHFPETTINKASDELLTKHIDRYFQMEKLLAQRQRVFLIPITRVHYSWRGKPRSFWVYGNEKTVYAPDYPQKYCCGCTIS